MTKTQVEVITSVQRRRRWSRAEKERIVAAAMEPLCSSIRVIVSGEHPVVWIHIAYIGRAAGAGRVAAAAPALGQDRYCGVAAGGSGPATGRSQSPERRL
jgi:hypothetical protein